MRAGYIKKVTCINQITVWIVDGYYIRSNIDIEFANFGHHLRYKYIPKNEFWIDNAHNKKERDIFVKHLELEHKLMHEGKSYAYALRQADLLERKMRKCKIAKSKRPSKIAHSKLYGKFKHINVWIVDGKYVRDYLYTDFTQGGHDKVYSFIPKNEIWIEDVLSAKEKKFVILHEIRERNLMRYGWPYYRSKLSAHRASSMLELYARRHQRLLDRYIRKEIERI